MTEEQFNKAVEINSRINALNRVKEEIKHTDKHRLWYAYKSDSGMGASDWRLVYESCMKHIADILDRHDKQIRQEIEDEIEALKKEIERL